MTLTNVHFLLAMVVNTIVKVSTISIYDIPYSISPDGQLSVLFQKNQNDIEVGHHPDGFAAWFQEKDDNRSTEKLWKHGSFRVEDIADDLDTVGQVVAVDADRFVFFGRNFDDWYCIGTVQILWNRSQWIELEPLHSTELRYLEDEGTLLLYHAELGDMVYLLGSTRLLVYNHQTFQVQSVNWMRTGNVFVRGDVLSSLLINRTHVLIARDAPSNRAE